MSRSALTGSKICFRSVGLLAACLLLSSGVSANAQQQPNVSAREVLDNAKTAYGPPPPKEKCKEYKEGDEIVVCAELEEQSQFRLRSDAKAKDDYARETMNQGNPQAPDVAGAGIFRGKPTFSVGSPPPPALMIDFSALPEAPPGSDADRIGRGLAPRGNNNAPRGNNNQGEQVEGTQGAQATGAPPE